MSVPCPGKYEKKNEVTQEELLHQKFRAKCRFRAAVRMVIANLYWIADSPEEYEGIDNVKRRVEQAMRGKPKKKQLLSIRDKALLNKPADERTDYEKRYIYRIIGGLKCFKRYPNNVKRKLAAVTYFKYYGPGRVIVREKQDAYAMYFIVTGDITVSLMIFDELLQQHVSLELGQMHQGDMFGEVSLLHNIPRTATCTTVGDCELLALMKDDFKNVLQASLQKQWDEVQQAMSSFTYFDNLDQVAKREGCIVAKMKSFDPDEVILGDGNGIPNFVYFVLSGRCQLIESLQVTTTILPTRTLYTLYDPFVEEEEEISTSEDLEKKYYRSQSNISKVAGSEFTSSVTIKSKESMRFDSLAIVSESLARFKANSLSLNGSAKLGKSNPNSLITNPEKCVTSQWNINESKTAKQLEPTEDPVQVMSFSQKLGDNIKKTEEVTRPDHKTYFMQVCIFNPGSTFGFGENMRDRRIVALSRVDCMLMPKVWLLQKNTANIWSRIQHYLEKKLPTKKQLFENFVLHRRWLDYRNQIVDEVVKRSDTVNNTTLHDVPYSIRMEEMLNM